MKVIDRDILSLAAPSIITNITTPLLALMDVAIVGHMGNAAYIAAIAVGGTLFNMTYWLFSFLRMGTSGLSAQASGQGGGPALDLVLQRGLTVALACSAAVLALSPLIGPLALSVMDTEEGVRELALRYFNILVWGAPAVLATYTLSGWCLGRKEAKAPMWISLVINVSNILVSLVLVLGMGLKIEGVAIGTLAAQWLGVLAFALLVARRYRPVRMSWRAVADGKALRRFFSVNADIFLRTLCLIAVTVWFTRAGSVQGVVVLAVNTLLMQFFILFSYFMDGFAFAGEALCGNALGAQSPALLRVTVRRLLKWGGGVALLFTAAYAAGGDAIMRLLSDDLTVTGAASEYMGWVALIPAAGFMAFTWDGVFIGITRTRQMLVTIALSTAVYFATYFTLSPRIGNHGLWIAFLAYLLTRGVALHLMYRRTRRRLFTRTTTL